MKYLILLIASFWGQALWAQSRPVVSKEVAGFRFGVFCQNKQFDKVPAAGTELGYIIKPRADPRFIAGAKQRLPGVLNMAFGVTGRAAGNRDIENAEIRVFKPNAKNPETWRGNLRIAARSTSFWYFGSPEEIVLGLWRIEAKKNGRLLYSVEFEVVAPDAEPELARACR